MLTRIHAANFGAIGPKAVEIDLSKVTVLVGENGTGKSTILRVPSVLAQTSEKWDRYGLMHEGDRARFASYEDMCFGRDEKVSVSLGVDLFLSSDDLFAYARQHQRYVEVPAGEFPKTIRVSYRVNARREPGGTTCAEQTLRMGENTATAMYGTDGQRKVRLPGADVSDSNESAEKILKPGVFVPRGNVSPADRVFDFAASAIAGFLQQNIRPADAVRGAATYDRELTTEAVRGTGPLGAWTLHWIHEQSLKHPDDGEALSDWLKRLGLGRFRVGVEATRMAGLFEDRISHATLPLYLAGHGHQQLLQPLAELALAPAGAVVLVEEPENSLHPDAVVRTAEVFAEAVTRRSVQLVVATHSPTLALALCREVLKNKLDAEQITLWQVHRDDKGTRAARLTVDDRGIVHPRWFSSFARAEAELLRDFAELEEHAAAQGGRARSGPARRRR